MTGDQVIEIGDILTASGIRWWIAGGWGVDALLGRETRQHRDLDISANPGAPARELLIERGFVEVVDWWPTRSALRHPDGREVDVHPVDRAAGGWLLQGLDDETSYFTPDGELTLGSIAGRVVPVISAAQQLAFHIGYEPAERDRTDMAALVDAGLLPAETEL